MSMERKEALEFRLRELEHRLRNTFATIFAMIDRAARSAGSVDELAGALRRRITALADLNEALGRARSDELDVVEMTRLALLPQAESDEQLEIRGAGRGVSPVVAGPLFLALHELAVNARKHGALSVQGGSVVVDVAAADGVLRIDWLECDGPPAQPPERNGFGMAVLTQGLAYEVGGRTELDFGPAGLRARLTVPLTIGNE